MAVQLGQRACSKPVAVRATLELRSRPLAAKRAGPAVAAPPVLTAERNLLGGAAFIVQGEELDVANRAAITIRCYASRGGSTIQFTSNGRYISFQTAGYNRVLQSQPIQPTASLQVFWLAVMNAVLANLQSTPLPP